LNDTTGTPQPTLVIRAKYQGALGDTIRATVTHPAGSTDLFDLTLSRMVTNRAGQPEPADVTTFTGLSMDPNHARYALKYVDFPWTTLSAPSPANLNRPAVTPAGTPRPLGGGGDGNPLAAGDYDLAYPILEREVDLINLMVLPKNAAGVAVKDLYGNASAFCQKKRAFLLMDPLEAWTTVQEATHNTTGVNSLRTGLVKDYSAVFFPRLTVNEAGRAIQVGPSGAVAGLMARIDASRGVWKAPAGTEADLRGITGLEYRFSDDENGVLNPRGINTIRIFPNGIVNWGARTMDGDDDFASEWKYIPVRRTALFIEESLYRGLKWVVFEPNDEPLWSQIRLNVGAFMHDLFRQGAFQGKTKQEAYFVKCDAETTTQNDINLGRVNVWVGFAPLKPAEFVILYLQQMTGQVQV
ncbi:MAG: phage tail sheath family protein, partial [Cytophagales bacterium]|nr:phage tail sheath family protein [Cytophagales bacterium]